MFTIAMTISTPLTGKRVANIASEGLWMPKSMQFLRYGTEVCSAAISAGDSFC